MEHLPIHLAEEVLLGSPIQYQWMHPFERYSSWMNSTAKNKARLKASVIQAFLTFEIAHFVGCYFRSSLHCPRIRLNESMQQS